MCHDVFDKFRTSAMDINSDKFLPSAMDINSKWNGQAIFLCGI